MTTLPMAMVAQVAHGDAKKEPMMAQEPMVAQVAHPATTHYFFRIKQ